MKHLHARPTCDVCGSPVESFREYEEDYFAGHVVFIASCHGASERVSIRRSELEASKVGINFGRAFVRPRQLEAGDP